MPRIAVLLNYDELDKPHFSGRNEYLDYCQKCYAEVDDAELAAKHEVPVDAVERDVEHFPYGDPDDNYTCEGCRRKLTERDD